MLQVSAHSENRGHFDDGRHRPDYQRLRHVRAQEPGARLHGSRTQRQLHEGELPPLSFKLDFRERLVQS